MSGFSNNWRSWHKHLIAATRIEEFSYFVVLPRICPRAVNVLPSW